MVYLFIVQQNKFFIYLYPFMVFPFMFLLRSSNLENIILKILPDLLVLIAVFYHLFFYRLQKNLWFYYVILLIYLILVFLTLMFAVADLKYLFVIIRQFLIPIFFLIIFIDISQHKNSLPLRSIKISILFFSIVCVISFLNIFGIAPIDPEIPELSPFLNFSNLEEDQMKFSGREFFGISLPRLNTFTGGAMGSASALLFCLGMISAFKSVQLKSRAYKISGLFLLAASVMTISNSILISIFIFFVFNYLIYKKYANLFLFSTMLIIASYIIFVQNFIFLIPAFEYLKETSLAAFYNYLLNSSYTDYLFGKGPRIVSDGYNFIPDDFIIDIGIFRVFIESGIFTFLFFLFFNYLVFKTALKILHKDKITSPSSITIYMTIFILFMLLIHGNMTILPPFYPLYAAAVAGIFSLSKIKQA